MLQKQNSLFAEIFSTVLVSGLTLFVFGWFIATFPELKSWQQLSVLGALALGGSIVFLGLLRFRARLQVSGVVETQLANLSKSLEINPVVTTSGVGAGWNRLVAYVRDRTLDQAIDRRLKENASNRTTEQYARAFRSLQEGIAITDSDGCIKYANPAWCALMGEAIEEENVEGAPVIEILTACRYTNFEDIADTIRSGMKPITADLACGLSVHDGVRQLDRLPLEGRSGESSGFVWTLRDVTQARIARESHEQFLASATHELRTPLTNIRAYTESLLTIEEVTPVQQKEFYNVIHSEAGRLGRLLNELLDIQQLEAGSMTLQTANFDILRMVQEVQEQLNPLLSEKKLNFVCRIAPDLKSIIADKEKITSCLINLLGNAIKYTPEQGEVKLIAERQESCISICVIDTGIGISESEISKVFDRFYRCQDERVVDVEGNGLGLAFCMEVAKLHGGDLTLESELNKGSKFTLQIPHGDED
ncbi:MAG: ATP-binding protein [Pirellulaceae bacterium]